MRYTGDLHTVVSSFCTYDVNFYYRKCFELVFHPVIERELREYMVYWNTHSIHFNRLANWPEDLFDMPEHYGRFACNYYCTIKGCNKIKFVLLPQEQRTI